MIARSWHGVVPTAKAEAFRKHLTLTGVTEAKDTPGNLAAYIYSTTQEGYEHFFMISYWDSIEAVKAFAGEKPHIAVCYPGDEEFGLISDPIVLHHEVDRIPVEFPLELK